VAGVRQAADPVVHWFDPLTLPLVGVAQHANTACSGFSFILVMMGLDFFFSGIIFPPFILDEIPHKQRFS